LTIRDAYRYCMIGVFLQTFLPGSWGERHQKAAVLARRPAAGGRPAVATVIMESADRLVGAGCSWPSWAASSGCAGLLDGEAKGRLVVRFIVGAPDHGGRHVGRLSADWGLLGRRVESVALRNLLQGLRFVGGPASERVAFGVAGSPATRRAWLWLMLLSWIGVWLVPGVFYSTAGANALWRPEMWADPLADATFLLVPIGLVDAVRSFRRPAGPATATGFRSGCIALRASEGPTRGLGGGHWCSAGVFAWCWAGSATWSICGEAGHRPPAPRSRKRPLTDPAAAAGGGGGGPAAVDFFAPA